MRRTWKTNPPPFFNMNWNVLWAVTEHVSDAQKTMKINIIVQWAQWPSNVLFVQETAVLEHLPGTRINCMHPPASSWTQLHTMVVGTVLHSPPPHPLPLLSLDYLGDCVQMCVIMGLWAPFPTLPLRYVKAASWSPRKRNSWAVIHPVSEHFMPPCATCVCAC